MFAFLLLSLSSFYLFFEVNLIKLLDLLREPLELYELLRLSLRSVEISSVITLLKQMEYPYAGATQDGLKCPVTLQAKERPQLEAIRFVRLPHLLAENFLPKPS